MSMTDPVADYLTRIRNGDPGRSTTSVEIPASKLKREMARILEEQGYIEAGRPRRRPLTTPASSSASSSSTPRTASPSMSGLQRASRARASATTSPATGIPKVLGGMGTAIVSTSQGVMTGHEARRRASAARSWQGLVAEP